MTETITHAADANGEPEVETDGPVEAPKRASVSFSVLSPEGAFEEGFPEATGFAQVQQSIVRATDAAEREVRRGIEAAAQDQEHLLLDQLVRDLAAEVVRIQSTLDIATDEEP